MISLNISPFVKWAGGKRQLLTQIKERMPKKYNNYIEPFVGGGAVLFDLLPKNAIINDINKSLMNSYKRIMLEPSEVMGYLDEFDTSIKSGGKDFFYSKREAYNDKLMKDEYDVELAALFIFLNKHCFNGLYRVNGKGLFNVPYNNSKQRSYDEKIITNISEYLKNITILEGDFQIACERAVDGDFLFIDSPYVPLNPTSFESYTKEGFDIESHRRLAQVFIQLTNKGCYCMLTNHNTEFINNLYSDYNCNVVNVKRSINSDASKRVGEEVIITNY